jgi:hypothetical protein
MAGLGFWITATLGSTPTPGDPARMAQARLMLGVLVVVIVALLGFVILTLVRRALRRSVMPPTFEPSSDATPRATPWTIAGQRVAPVEEDGDGAGGDGGDAD